MSEKDERTIDRSTTGWSRHAIPIAHSPSLIASHSRLLLQDRAREQEIK